MTPVKRMMRSGLSRDRFDGVAPRVVGQRQRRPFLGLRDPGGNVRASRPTPSPDPSAAVIVMPMQTRNARTTEYLRIVTPSLVHERRLRATARWERR